MSIVNQKRFYIGIGILYNYKNYNQLHYILKSTEKKIVAIFMRGKNIPNTMQIEFSSSTDNTG